MEIAIYLTGLSIVLTMAFFTWLLSLYLKDVSIVDSVWSLMFLGATIGFVLLSANVGTRSMLVTLLVTLWAVRLALHLTIRNWGQPEDQRYVAIREKYSPNFAYKSLVIIFVFQALLAWIVMMPIWPAVTVDMPLALMDIVAAGIVLTGLLFESLADWQLTRFKANPENKGKVMDRGLWRYSRHPNYFGEAVIWWGFYLFALSTGAWWTILGPLLITWLLLKFSGVVMLEETISQRRPAYRDYIERTNAFVPGKPKTGAAFREVQS